MTLSVERAHSGRVLGFAPAPLGHAFEIRFVSASAEYHALWVNFDVDWDLRPGPHGFEVLVQIDVDGRPVRTGRFFQFFGLFNFVTESERRRTGMTTYRWAPDGFENPRRGLDLWVDSRRNPVDGWRGRMQVITCMVEVPLPAGRPAVAHGTIRPLSDARAHHFRAEAFVALPYGVSGG